ncbi:MAG TPA: lipoprotein-releasing ABC transporter permease subunit [Vicinamibacterales bacterium]|nr:lipoprotein-releasing ABC transporter permease subunit [Vicinamibacterales bacterium]
MPFELQVALRYLLAKRRQVFISVISLVSTIGVTVGVAALVISMALMTGLQGELQSKILGSSAHVFVFKPAGIEDYRAEVEKIRHVPGVIGAAPAVMGKGMISGSGAPGFIAVKGIDPELEPSVTEMPSMINDGSLLKLTSVDEDELPGIVIGKDLAGDIGAMVGDTVTVTTPEGSLTPMGVMPRQRRFKLVGTFRLGLYDVDASTGLVGLESGMRLAGKDRIDHIEVKVADIYDAPRIADQIAVEFGPAYVTQDWTDINQQLYSALMLEKIGMGIGIGLIVMVAALNIIASLILLVMEKTRDIAILKTMGASKRSIMLVFLLQGSIIGVIGTVIGALLGTVLANVLDRYRLISIPSDVYQVSYLPFKVLPGDLASVIAGAVIVCFFATLYPSRQAAKLDPAQALRYE